MRIDEYEQHGFAPGRHRRHKVVPGGADALIDIFDILRLVCCLALQRFPFGADKIALNGYGDGEGQHKDCSQRTARKLRTSFTLRLNDEKENKSSKFLHLLLS